MTYERHVPTQPDAICRSPAGTSYFTGMMGRVMVFGKALTAAEASHLYHVQADAYWD
ncbi:LamG domain-containing protein [Paenibacillus hemerocallicola]|uniref:LamG domain-containing protein n=1 Tax=Paenibacillus hemerocallicola TaxID=1172614 RepID=A0A5C4SW85_9BACL|nr:LamG domain-containing protein [Paenibacillus hemerocallicola]TNJ58675.1 LamG domain-containing protein [Paenibacillus hemerocallicola]